MFYCYNVYSRNRSLKNDIIIGEGTQIDNSAELEKTILGENVIVGKNAKLQESVIFSNTVIKPGAIITHSIIGPNCILKNKSKVTAGSIVGSGTVIEKDIFIENSLIQAHKPDNCKY